MQNSKNQTQEENASHGSQNVGIIVPIRGIHSSMQRLRDTLKPEEVDQLVYDLLTNTISFARKINFPIILVCKEEEGIDFKGVDIFLDSGAGLNKALEEVVSTYEFSKYLLVMPDLPGLEDKHADIIYNAISMFDNFVTPTRDGGTAISCLPSTVYEQHLYGPKSSQKIVEYCNENKMAIGKIIIQELLRDLDTYEDLQFWNEIGRI